MNDRPLVPRGLAALAAWGWRLLVVAGLVAVAAWIVGRLSLVVVPVLVALLFSTLLVPVARFLRGRGLPDAAAASGAFVLAIVVLGGVGYLVGPPVAEEVGNLDVSLRGGADEVGEWVADTFPISEARVDGWIDDAEEQLRANTGTIAGGVLSGASIAIEVLAGLALGIVLLFFFVKDGERLWGFLRDLLPEHRRDDAQELAERGYRVLGTYLRGVAFVGVVDAVLIAVALIVLGVPLVLPLALLIFFGAFFPIVGAWLSGMAAALVALVDEGFTTALIVVAWITVVQQIEGNVLYPVVVGRTLHVHPVVVLLALTAGGVLAGLAGAFLAVPVAAVGGAFLAWARERETPPPP